MSQISIKVKKFKPNWNVPKGYKYCWACKVVKPISEFYNSVDKFSNKDGRCKACDKLRKSSSEYKDYQREYRQNNPEKSSHNWVISKYGSYANYRAYLKGKDL